MNPNIQKLVHCAWRKPVIINGMMQNITVHYSILYERKNHIENAKYIERIVPSGYKWKELMSHTDELDDKIIESLVNYFAVALKLENFRYYPRETLALISTDIEEWQKAMISRQAIGWAHTPINFHNESTGQVKQLNTRAYFICPKDAYETIYLDIPPMLTIEGVTKEKFESLITVPFMKNTDVIKVIEKFNP